MARQTPHTIDPQRVQEIFSYCVVPEGKKSPDAVEVLGIGGKVYRFDPNALQTHRSTIAAMVNLLPDQFRSQDRGGSGGWGFTMLHTDRNGHHWTSAQADMLAFMLLAVASGLAQYLRLPGYTGPLPTMWERLPGGMPYIVIP